MMFEIKEITVENGEKFTTNLDNICKELNLTWEGESPIEANERKKPHSYLIRNEKGKETLEFFTEGGKICLVSSNGLSVHLIEKLWPTEKKQTLQGR